MCSQGQGGGALETERVVLKGLLDGQYISYVHGRHGAGKARVWSMARNENDVQMRTIIPLTVLLCVYSPSPSASRRC